MCPIRHCSVVLIASPLCVLFPIFSSIVLLFISLRFSSFVCHQSELFSLLRPSLFMRFLYTMLLSGHVQEHNCILSQDLYHPSRILVTKTSSASCDLSAPPSVRDYSLFVSFYLSVSSSPRLSDIAHTVLDRLVAALRDFPVFVGHTTSRASVV